MYTWQWHSCHKSDTSMYNCEFNLILLKTVSRAWCNFWQFFFIWRTKHQLPHSPAIVELLWLLSLTAWVSYTSVSHKPGCYYLAFGWLLACYPYITYLFSESPNWFIMQANGSLLLLNLVIDNREVNFLKGKTINVLCYMLCVLG